MLLFVHDIDIYMLEKKTTNKPKKSAVQFMLRNQILIDDPCRPQHAYHGPLLANNMLYFTPIDVYHNVSNRDNKSLTIQLSFMAIVANNINL